MTLNISFSLLFFYCANIFVNILNKSSSTFNLICIIQIFLIIIEGKKKKKMNEERQYICWQQKIEIEKTPCPIFRGRWTPVASHKV